MQFFGDIVHAFRLADRYEGAPIHCGYIVDPQCKPIHMEEREPDFSEEAIPVYADQSPNADSVILDTLRERSTRILRVFHHELRVKRMIEETVREVFGQYKGQAFTPEIASQLAKRFIERLADQMGEG